MLPHFVDYHGLALLLWVNVAIMALAILGAGISIGRWYERWKAWRTNGASLVRVRTITRPKVARPTAPEPGAWLEAQDSRR